MSKKYDGVIEAVRYNPSGLITQARGYELRGVTYSDRVLFDRETLLERMKKGKKFIIGQRKEFWGSTFDFGQELQLVNMDGKDYIATRGETSKRDEFEDTPAF